MGNAPALNDLLGRNAEELRATLCASLASLDWHRRLGKQRGGEQTLLEHCMAVMDVLCVCMPLFTREARPALERDEALGMVLAAVAHDAGKASDAFQAYLRGCAPHVEHVDAEEIRRVIVHVGQALGSELSHVDDIVSEAVLHDRRMRGDRSELTEWSRDHVSPRWRKLADYVNHADSLASTENVVAAESFLRRNPLLIGTAAIASYQVQVRGVSTTFLHEAAQDAFAAVGFRPILHFADGTLFAAGADGPSPSRDAIAQYLRAKIDKLFADRRDRLPELAVGDATADFLPRPEYVRRDNLNEVFRVATTRAGRKRPPATPKQQADREKDIAKWKDQWRRNRVDETGPKPVDIQALLDIGPEACAFRIAKEIVSELLTDQRDVLQVKSEYEKRFGDGSFEKLTSRGTLKAVEDYAACVQPWHRLTRDGHAVGDVDPEQRIDLLVSDLKEVIGRVLQEARAPLPSDTVINAWSDCVMKDIAIESAPPPRDMIDGQLAGYVALKASSHGKKKSPQQCAQCAALIGAGEAERGSKALGNVGSYTNRLLAFDAKAQPPICRACVADLELAQLCLGGPLKTAVAIVPRRGLGLQGARDLVARVRQLRITLDRQLSPETADPASYVAMTLPQQALRATSVREALIRPVGRQQRVKKLVTALKETVGEEGLAGLSSDHQATFDSLEVLAQALVEGNAPAAVREDPDVRAAVASVLGGGRIDFAAITPNLVVVCLDRDLGERKDSDADRALYSFGLATLFAIELDMACLIAVPAELRTALASRNGRTVYVPANGPARRLLGADWLGIDDARRWLSAIRAAIVLRERAGANSLLEVLRYPSAGYAVRRIEQRPDAKAIGPGLWPFVQDLKEVLG